MTILSAIWERKCFAQRLTTLTLYSIWRGSSSKLRHTIYHSSHTSSSPCLLLSPPLSFSSSSMSLISTLPTPPLLQSTRQMSFLLLLYPYTNINTSTHTHTVAFIHCVSPTSNQIIHPSCGPWSPLIQPVLTSIDFCFVNNIRRASSQYGDRSLLCWFRQAYNDHFLCVFVSLRGHSRTQLLSTRETKIDLLMTIDRLWGQHKNNTCWHLSEHSTLVDMRLSTKRKNGLICIKDEHVWIWEESKQNRHQIHITADSDFYCFVFPMNTEL